MNSTGKPDDPASRFSLAIFRINGLLMRSGESITKPFGQSSARWQVLGRAGDRPQTVAQMARDMGLARQSVQRVADVLEIEGLVIYKENPAHERARLIELTLNGKKVLTAIYLRNDEWSRRMATKLDLRGLKKIAAELERIGRVLEDDLKY